MPFPGFTQDDFNIADTAGSNRVREKLAKFARDILQWASGDPRISDLFAGFYVTRKLDFSDQWVAILPVPVGDEFEFLTMFPHVHLVLGQADPSWIGVNIEFENPRRIARDKLNPQFHEDFAAALAAARQATDSQMILLRKSVVRNNQRLYWWEDQFDPSVVRFQAISLTHKQLAAVYQHINVSMPPHPDPSKEYQPVLSLGRFLDTEELQLPGPDFVALSQEILRRLAPFLRILRN